MKVTKAFVEFIGKVAEPGVLNVMAIVPLAEEMGVCSLMFLNVFLALIVGCRRYENAEFRGGNMAQSKVQQYILSPTKLSLCCIDAVCTITVTNLLRTLVVLPASAFVRTSDDTEAEIEGFGGGHCVIISFAPQREIRICFLGGPTMFTMDHQMSTSLRFPAVEDVIASSCRCTEML